MKETNSVRFLPVLAAVLLLIVAVPIEAADYYVFGWVYAATSLSEGTEPPPNPLPSSLTDDEIVGEESMVATGMLAMTRVDVIDDSNGAVITSGVARLGAYYTSFTYAGASRQIRFEISDAATGTSFGETQAVTVSAGSNQRYLLVQSAPREVGGTVPHPSGSNHYAFTRVGLVEAAHIGSDGLADFSSLNAKWRDAPFGRSLKIFGAASLGYYPLAGIGNYCYKVKATPAVGSPFYVDDNLYKRRYEVSSAGGSVSVTSSSEKVGPFNEAGGQCYHFTAVAEVGVGGSTIFWSFPDQVAQWNTRGIDGSHDLSIEVYNRSTSADLGVLGAPLTLEINNTPVNLSFDKIEQRSSTDTTQVDLLTFPCDIVNLTGGRKLFIEFTAHHPDGYLAMYDLSARANSEISWTSWDSGSYSGVSFSGVNPGQVNRTSTHITDTCAYAIYLHAWSRTTNGYHRLFHPHKLKTYYIQR